MEAAEDSWSFWNKLEHAWTILPCMDKVLDFCFMVFLLRFRFHVWITCIFSWDCSGTLHTRWRHGRRGHWWVETSSWRVLVGDSASYRVKMVTGSFALPVMSYCWWLKSCTTWDVWNPINSGINCCRISAINSMSGNVSYRQVCSWKWSLLQTLFSLIVVAIESWLQNGNNGCVTKISSSYHVHDGGIW